MAESDILRRWLEEAGDDEILIDPEDINLEAAANTWSFSPPDDELNQITVAGVEHFINEIIEKRRARLNGQEMTFYCWHDFQTRQLRFGLVSKSHGRIPFRCEVEQTTELSSVIEQVVNDDWLNDQYFRCEADYEGYVECQETPFVLLVFVANLAG
ncbi:MAG: hypothetical protein FWC42_02210 [Proteobacteria bacterium]|nr:hypothetical protein [Pseudomonadota bacterium]